MTPPLRAQPLEVQLARLVGAFAGGLVNGIHVLRFLAWARSDRRLVVSEVVDRGVIVVEAPRRRELLGQGDMPSLLEVDLVKADALEQGAVLRGELVDVPGPLDLPRGRVGADDRGVVRPGDVV